VQLVEYVPEKRMTAAQALAHPLISASRVGKTLLKAKSLGAAATEAAVSLTEPWLSNAASGAKHGQGTHLAGCWVLRGQVLWLCPGPSSCVLLPAGGELIEK
jgi:hypothetical protein